jgi:putative flippase GtrA
MPTPVLDLVIPVYNEQAVLTASVRRVVGHLRQTFPYPFRVTIADNASTDATWQVAHDLVSSLPEVAAVQLEAKGRGRALKQVWLHSDAPILAYVDVDLSTDLDALWPLVAPLMSGHSDLAIGSRLARGARTVRGPKREFISRCYNLILRGTLGASFTDAQCGFKAIRADVARELLPYVEDTTWFFDTELLILAQKCELRIHEVPVDWFDDPDSRVDVRKTATDDLRGVARMRRRLATQAIPTQQIADRMGRRMPDDDVTTQIVRFAGVGAASTVLHLSLFAAMDVAGLGSQLTNTLALLVATVFNTGANRRWTFGVRGPRSQWRHQTQGLFLTGLTWAMTSGALALLATLPQEAPTWLSTAVVALANVVATVLRFVLMKWWVFGHRDSRLGEAPRDDTMTAIDELASTGSR